MGRIKAIMSSAGTGKTTRLTSEVNKLIEGGADPSRILVITFSVAGKDELVSRITNKKVMIRTIHSLFLWLLNRNEMSKVGEIIKELDRIKIIDSIIRNSPNRKSIEKYSGVSVKDILQYISFAKNFCTLPMTCYNNFLFEKKPKMYKIDAIRLGQHYNLGENQILPDFLPYFDAIYTLYEQEKGGRFDFDDILLSCKNRITKNQFGIRDEARKLFDHIFVDEFQDTNQIQFDVIREIVRDDCSLTVIGDWKQNIYEWRGADYRLLKNIKRYYPDIETEYLDKTYRNGRKILNIANGVACCMLGDNPITTAREFDGEVMLAEFRNAEAEMQYVLSRLPEAEDTFVLARNNAQLQEVELSIQLQHPELEYSISGVPFCGSEMVLDLTATLAAIFFPESLGSRGLERVLGVIARFAPVRERKNYVRTKNTQHALLYSAIQTLEQCQEEAKDSPEHFMDLFERFITNFRYAENSTRNQTADEKSDTLDSIELFVRFGRKFPSVMELLKFCARNAVSTKKPDAPVKLMTVHASKGMQAKEVILYGLSEGKFPSKKSVISESGMLGEVRLLYVAVSRAIERLVVTCNIPSQFFKEIEVFNLTKNPDYTNMKARKE